MSSVDEQRLLLRWPSLGAELELEIVAQEAERSLQLRSGRFEVEVRLEPGLLRFIHRGTASEEETLAIQSSWQASLAVLAHYLEHHPGEPRQAFWLRRTAPVPAETAHVYFSHAAALSSWLGRGSVGPVGSRYEIELRNGTVLSGRVLANVPGRDVVLSWEGQANSVLVFRTLPGGAGDRQLLILWSRWGAPLETTPARAMLDAALLRLSQVLGNPPSA